MRSIVKVSFLLVVLAAALCHPPSSECATPGESSSPKPLWEIDLAKLGYQGREPVKDLGPMGVGADQQGIVFTSSNVAVVYFVVHDDPPGATAPHREPLFSDPFRLVAVFLNTESGELIKKLDWTLPSDPQFVPAPFFFPATNGRFVVGLGNTMRIYSPEHELLAYFDSRAEWNAKPSPSGEFVLFQLTGARDGKEVSVHYLADTEKLSIAKSWDAEPDPTVVWDEEFAWSKDSTVYFQAPGAAPRELLPHKAGSCRDWAFLNRDVLSASCGSSEGYFLILSTDGKVIRNLDMGLERVGGPAVASANGQQFAFHTYKWGSGRNRSPEQVTARVFGFASEHPLLKLEVPHHYGANENAAPPFAEVALSPDGELLAVKSGAIVQMYRVPALGASARCTSSCANEATASGSPSSRELPAPTPSVPSPSSQQIEQMLSWFPADTESIMAATGPFMIPARGQSAGQPEPNKKPEQEVEDAFREMPLTLFAITGRRLKEHLRDEPIVLAMEGSRDFRPPSGLGMAKFQGCVIAVFAGDITARVNSFLKEPSSSRIGTEQIEGHEVSVFEEKLEADVWTTYVAFPRPDVVVVATNKEYLREVLERIGGKVGTRALPGTLPEWKHVNVHAPFWAIRHYNKKGAETDPTSPFGHCPGNVPDNEAVGLTFSFDPTKSKTATLKFLSGDEDSLQRTRKNLFSQPEEGVRETHVRYRQAEPGVLEGSYDLEYIESAEYFVLILEGLLGHPVYL